MKALLKLVPAAVLLAAMVAIPLFAFGHMVDQMTAAAPHFASPIEEAEFWTRAFGP